MKVTALLILASYVLFVSGLGYAGHRTQWKGAVIRRSFLVALIPAGVAVIISIGLWLQSPSTTPIKEALLRTAGQLVEAERKGDPAAASALLDGTTQAFRDLNPTGTPSPEKRDCLLAASHLSDGITSVMRGGVWAKRSQFDATISGCRF